MMIIINTTSSSQLMQSLRLGEHLAHFFLGLLSQPRDGLPRLAGRLSQQRAERIRDTLRQTLKVVPPFQQGRSFARVFAARLKAASPRHRRGTCGQTRHFGGGGLETVLMCPSEGGGVIHRGVMHEWAEWTSSCLPTETRTDRRTAHPPAP